jgi:hypothetical protein
VHAGNSDVRPWKFVKHLEAHFRQEYRCVFVARRPLHGCTRIVKSDRAWSPELVPFLMVSLPNKTVSFYLPHFVDSYCYLEF